MPGLTVLLTNFELATFAGSQLYLRDVALGLLRRGHTPVVYAPVLGRVALELTAATVPVVDDLAKITAAPDVIHGQHNHELLTALLRFPGVPAIRVCHGWLDEAPQPFPRVRRYVAVDDTTRDRCQFEWGVPADQLEVVLNFVDLDRFTVRPPLPARPLTALVFSNSASEHRRAVTDACEAAGIRVDVTGLDTRSETAHPERVLQHYDLVFAKGRSAIEALASGTAVILCDRTGVGPLVTTTNLEHLRRLNFGLRTLQEPFGRETLARQIGQYDPVDARRVTAEIRATADAGAAIDSLIGIYRAVVAEAAAGPPADLRAEAQAASAYLERLSPRLRWSEDPRAIRYLLLRSVDRRLRRVPGLATVMHSAWARRLVRGTRARWRARLTGSS
jgi:hypothetical protein